MNYPMSNTKIVIDKALFDRLLKVELNDDSSKDLTDFVECLRSISAEIQIDQSIEERAESKVKDVPSEHYASIIKEAIIESATHQQIIEQMKAKEKEHKCTRCGSKNLTLCSQGEYACDDCGEFPIII